MLSKKEIEENKKIYVGLLKKYKLYSDEFYEFLTVNGLFEAPASTMTSLHYAFEGGLVAHLIDVTKKMLYMNNNSFYRNPELVCDVESVVKVGMLHDLGKMNLYKPNPSEWHRKNLGKMYEFNENLVSMTVGERSVYYINNMSNIKLNEEEYQAILNLQKDGNDAQSVWHGTTLSDILKTCSMAAIKDQKCDNKNSKIEKG